MTQKIHFNKKELFNSSIVANEKTGVVLSYFNRIDSIENKTARLVEYGPTYADIENGVTVDTLNEKRNNLLISLMYSMFALNSEYHKVTGKYLMGKKEKSLETAEAIYEALWAVI